MQRVLAALVIATCFVASVKADCSTYCTNLLATCSAYQSFTTQAQCLLACATYPTGVTGNVNSLECRESYVNLAVGGGDAATNCYYGSVHGGGICGSTCDAYCNLMTTSGTWCATNVPVYASVAECKTSFCSHFPNSTFPVGSTPAARSSGNTQECRVYHAMVGVSQQSTFHCTHATPLSADGQCVTSDTNYIGDGNSQTATYCDNHIRICGTTTTNPTYGMYLSVAQCKALAGKYPRALPNAQGGNSLDARNYHVGVASTNAASMFHCQHSGLNGKNFCTDSALAYDQSLGCDSFCEQNLRICNSTNTQFTSLASCVRFCNALPAATEAPYPTSGDSLQCRFYHLGVAGMSDANAATHCPHTGITGGDGQCGTTAEAFCDVEIATCNATGSSPYNTLAQYSSKAQCVAAASAFPRDLTGTPASPVTAGNTLDCRQYHAGVAQQTSALATAHCFHTGQLGGDGVCGTSCQGFCSTVMTGCTAAVGGLSFASNAECLSYCATFPVGTLTYPAQQTSGNTLACRSYHAGVALAGDNSTKVTHCPHAMAVSGSNTCGTACEAYCNTIQAACNSTGANAQFATVAACTTACASYATSGTTGATTGATLQCRQYHAGVALLGDAATKTAHCPHAGSSPTAFCVANGASSSAASSLVMVAAAIAAVFAMKQL